MANLCCSRHLAEVVQDMQAKTNDEVVVKHVEDSPDWCCYSQVEYEVREARPECKDEPLPIFTGV